MPPLVAAEIRQLGRVMPGGLRFHGNEGRSIDFRSGAAINERGVGAKQPQVGRVCMTDEDIKALRSAVLALEHPGWAARLSNIAGRPIELMTKALPEGATKAIAAATTKELNAALAGALPTIRHQPQPRSRLLHKVVAWGS